MIYAVIFAAAIAIEAAAFMLGTVESSPLTVRRVLSEGLVRRKPRKLFRNSKLVSKSLEPP